MPDDTALLLGIEDILQPRRETNRRRRLTLERDAELASENFFHPLALARAQNAVIDENALEAIANRAMNQCRRNRRIDPAGKSEQHLVARPDLRANLGDLGVDEFAMVQSPGSPQIFSTKLRNIWVPHGVCTTSG